MKHIKLFENFEQMNEETIKGQRGVSVNLQHDYITLKMPVGNYTSGRYGAKASGQLVTMKGAFEAIDKYVEDAIKSGKNYGDVFKEIVTKPEILDKLVPGWDKPKEITLKIGDTVKMSEPSLAKKYPDQYKVKDVRKTNVFIEVPKKGGGGVDIIGFPKYALELSETKPVMNEDHEANESPIYEELEEGFMKMLMKGTGIQPKDVKSVESNNNYMIVRMRHGDNFRIDFQIKHVA